jgi:hypothetical protein
VSVENDERSGWPSTTKTTENVERIQELIRRHTIHEFTDTVGISYGVCQEILTENLNMCHIATKFVPRLLTNDQKQRYVNVRLELWEKANEVPAFISRIIMDDENWIYGYDPVGKDTIIRAK